MLDLVLRPKIGVFMVDQKDLPLVDKPQILLWYPKGYSNKGDIGWQGEGGGSKNRIFGVTSFMDGPLVAPSDFDSFRWACNIL